MRIIVYAVLILSLSCDSLGTNEFQASLTYHEYVGFAWQEFILKNYNTSIDYFNSAKEVALEEEEYDNSAEIGLGWVYLMRANQYMSSISSSYRDSAFNQLQYDTLETEAISSYSQTCNYEFCCDSCFVNDKEVGPAIAVRIEPNYSKDRSPLPANFGSFGDIFKLPVAKIL